MSRSRVRLGASGEDQVAAWYEARGYRVLARNWRCREGEVDLICVQGRRLVFCEVKTRSSAAFGHPAESVTPVKQRRIRMGDADGPRCGEHSRRGRGDQCA